MKQKILKTGAAIFLGGAAVAGLLCYDNWREHSNRLRAISTGDSQYFLLYSQTDGLAGFTEVTVSEESGFDSIAVYRRNCFGFGNSIEYIDHDRDGYVDEVTLRLKGTYANYSFREFGPMEVFLAADRDYQAQLQRFGLTKLLKKDKPLEKIK